MKLFWKKKDAYFTKNVHDKVLQNKRKITDQFTGTGLIKKLSTLSSTLEWYHRYELKF